MSRTCGIFAVKSALKPVLILTILIAPLDLCCQQSKKALESFTIAGSTYLEEEIDYWRMSSGSQDFFAVGQSSMKIFSKSDTREIDFSPGYIKTTFSPDASFFCQSMTQNETGVDDLRTTKFVVFDSQGTLKYELRQERHFDQPMQDIFVHSGGGLVIGNPALGRLFFYNGTGELMKEASLFPDAEFDLERVLSLSGSPGRGIVIVMATRRGASPTDSGVESVSGEPTIFAFDSEGLEKWKRELPRNAAGELAVSRDGRYILAATYSVDSRGNLSRITSLLDGNGEILRSYDFLFRSADFSPESGFFIMADRAEALIFQLPSGDELGRFRINRRRGMISAARIGIGSSGRAAILTAKEEFMNGAFLFSDPKLYILDQTGRAAQEIPFDDKIFKDPALYLSTEGHRISVGFRHDFIVLEVGS